MSRRRASISSETAQDRYTCERGAATLVLLVTIRPTGYMRSQNQKTQRVSAKSSTGIARKETRVYKNALARRLGRKDRE